MPKALINAYDAFALLNSRKLYPNQLKEVLTDELNTKKVLCISDTTDVLLKDGEVTKSIAHTIEKAKLGAHLEVIQTDYKSFAYNAEEGTKFGAHLPQNVDETRREYLKVDSQSLESDLSATSNVDVIVGRSCLCACLGDGHLCGGIDTSKKAQKEYLSTLIKLNPSIMILSAAQATFIPDESDEADIREKANAQAMYKTAQANFILACEELNREAEESGSTYRFAYVPPNKNFTMIYPNPSMENGYMLVAYDTTKVDFRNTAVSLQTERAEARRLAEERVSIKVGATSPAFFKEAPVRPNTTPEVVEQQVLKS
ncbi:hypothetical protein [Legionella sp. km772]|uniref:hypothetical protein n=1 Tax=Legionella sp. km772 TaxID=2498111 RepID=UPI000F99561E|nr:hypothetical protein [Legionella sp. km772]RUR12621.1 hypothetical protein ELY15_04500 [Legionella sp. km772]